MKKTNLILLAKSILSLALIGATATAAEPKKLLVVTTTAGFRHSSISTAEKVLAKLAQQNGFTLDYAQQPPKQPGAPKKPQNPTPEALEKFQAEETKFKEADAQWQAELKQNLS